MTNLINTRLPLKSYTVENWEEILEHGSFRGYNIQRFNRKLEKDPNSIQFNAEKASLVYAKKNGELVELSLIKVKKCKSRWSFSRLIYWIKTSLSCSEKTNTRKLAEFIEQKTHLFRQKTQVIDSEEKNRWREHKLANNFTTLGEMEAVLSPEVYAQINGMSQTEKHKVLIGKVHQAKEFYKDDYYTFIHGQSLAYWVINQFVKELEKLKNPDQDVSLYHFLRLPESELKTTRQEHINRSKFNDSYDKYLGDELLSVDGTFFHDYSDESTNDFVKRNSSFLSSNKSEVINKILEHYSIFSFGASNKVKNLISEFKNLESIGHIYTISIPKDKFSDYVYTAHEYGVACKCVDDQVKRIDDLQNNIELNKCTYTNRLPQYRILTHFLKTEETPITLHTPVSKEKKNEFKLQIRALAEELYFEGVA